MGHKSRHSLHNNIGTIEYNTGNKCAIGGISRAYMMVMMSRMVMVMIVAVGMSVFVAVHSQANRFGCKLRKI